MVAAYDLLVDFTSCQAEDESEMRKEEARSVSRFDWLIEQQTDQTACTQTHIRYRYIMVRNVTECFIRSRHVTSRQVTLHYVTLQYITLHFATWRYIAFRIVDI